MTEFSLRDDQQGDNVDIRQYIAVLIPWAWLIILATVVAGAAAYFVSKQQIPVYRVSTTILINEAPSTRSTDYNSILASERLTRTYSEMMVRQPILAKVIAEKNLTITANDLRRMITVSPVRDTQLIEMSIEATDPVVAADVANSVIDIFSADLRSLQTDRFSISKQSLQTQLLDMEKQIQDTAKLIESTTDKSEKDRLESKNSQYRQIYSSLLLSLEQVRLSEAQTTSNVVQVEPAIPSISPIRPQVLQNTAIAALIGLMLSLGVVTAVELLDDTIKSPEDIRKKLGLPVLGIIIHHAAEEGKPVTESQPRSPVSEAYRTLRTNVQFASVDFPLRTILVTSPTPGEGKSTITTNLAIVFAQGGRKVTIVDADLRRPSMHKKLGLPNRQGLSNLFMQSNENLDGYCQKTRIENLSIVTSGSIPPNPSELLGSNKMGEIISRLHEDSEIVLLDTPPALAVTDPAVLMPIVDGVLLVMKPGSTKLSAARQVVETLHRTGANILGVVLNNVETKRTRYGYYYYRGYQENNKYYHIDEKNQAKEDRAA